MLIKEKESIIHLFTYEDLHDNKYKIDLLQIISYKSMHYYYYATIRTSLNLDEIGWNKII